MSSKILIKTRPGSSQVIQIEKDSVLSYLPYNTSAPYLVGSIYKGKISKILPGMQACFVDIGLHQDVFLHAKDLLHKKTNQKPLPIQKQLTTGQVILVQIIKDAIGTKAARASMKISLAGSKLIYIPQEPANIRVSKKITLEKERKRLQDVLEKLDPKGLLVVRTKSKGEVDFNSELKHLYQTWESIKKNKQRKPGCIFSDIPIELQILRDGLNSKKVQVWIDNKEIYEKAQKFVKNFLPQFIKQIHFYKQKRDLFEKYNVDTYLKNSLKRKIYLKSGGVVVIDENEAMTTIDINTARSVGKTNQEKTVLNTNLEAIKEITNQIRIRNLGGIIAIDLIDMEEESSTEQALSLIKSELKKDLIYTEFVSMSSLFVVELTRKRTRPSLRNLMCNPCPTCRGDGYLKSVQTISMEIFKNVSSLHESIQKEKRSFLRKLSRQKRIVQVECHPSVMEWIQNQESSYLNFLSETYQVKLNFKHKEHLHIEKFNVHL